MTPRAKGFANGSLYLQRMNHETLLMVADSEHDSNVLYATGMFVPDPFIYFSRNGTGYMVLNDLEIDRARKQASHCRVVSWSNCCKQLRQQKVPRPGFAHVIRFLVKGRKWKRIVVPHNFPHGLARELARMRIKINVKAGAVFPQREVKSFAEVKKISAALMMAEVGLAEGIQALKLSKIGKDRKLIYHNLPLTSERLRAIIDTAIVHAGGLANHTIVAGGHHGCDPHEPGFGPLRAEEPIILDIFPRSQKTGYFGDITRTVVKGRASEAVRKLYDAVERAQETAFLHLRESVPASEVHQKVQEFFQKEGFKTGKVGGRMQGFFHGTGHGLGLDIHEAPRVGADTTEVLQAGHVVTVEPGLYYPSMGGVRLEDVAWITRKGARNLTKFEKALEI